MFIFSEHRHGIRPQDPPVRKRHPAQALKQQHGEEQQHLIPTHFPHILSKKCVSFPPLSVPCLPVQQLQFRQACLRRGSSRAIRR